MTWCLGDLIPCKFADKCQHPGCQQQTKSNHSLCGTSVLLKWTCPLGHKGKFWLFWKASGVLVNNLQTPAAIFLSGCSFITVAKMPQFLGLSFPSKSTFFRVQRLYVIPTVLEWWKWQQEKIFDELKGQEFAVAGDGRWLPWIHCKESLLLSHGCHKILHNRAWGLGQTRDKHEVSPNGEAGPSQHSS